jgi:prolipoprotein diacylglyceryltransferase
MITRIITALAGLALCAYASFRIVQTIFTDKRFGGVFGNAFMLVSILLMIAGIVLLVYAFRRTKSGRRFN